MLTMLRLQVKSWFAGERCDKNPNHGRKQCQKRRIIQIFSVFESGSKRWLVWEWTQWMDVGEKVVHKQFEGRERADGFSVEDSVG